MPAHTHACWCIRCAVPQGDCWASVPIRNSAHLPHQRRSPKRPRQQARLPGAAAGHVPRGEGSGLTVQSRGSQGSSQGSGRVWPQGGGVHSLEQQTVSRLRLRLGDWRGQNCLGGRYHLIIKKIVPGPGCHLELLDPAIHTRTAGKVTPHPIVLSRVQSPVQPHTP